MPVRIAAGRSASAAGAQQPHPTERGVDQDGRTDEADAVDQTDQQPVDRAACIREAGHRELCHQHQREDAADEAEDAGGGEQDQQLQLRSEHLLEDGEEGQRMVSPFQLRPRSIAR